MSRSGYVDDGYDPLSLGRWRGAVRSATRGARGQAFFRELIVAMDAMPEKALIANDLICKDGMCAMGVVAAVRGTDVSEIDPEDPETVAKTMNLAEALVQEIAYQNDECGADWLPDANGRYRFLPETPEARWARMRAWAEKQLTKTEDTTHGE